MKDNETEEAIIIIAWELYDLTPEEIATKCRINLKKAKELKELFMTLVRLEREKRTTCQL